MPADTPDWQGGSQGQTLLGTIVTPGDFAIHSNTFPVPTPWTQTVCYRVRNTVPAHLPQSVTANGDVTGSLYLNYSLGALTPLADVEDFFLPDKQLVCSVTDNGTEAIVDFLAFNFGLMTAKPTVFNNPFGRVYAERASGGTTTMQAGAAGLLVHVWGWMIQVDNQSSGTTIAWIEDDTSTSPANRIGMIVAGGIGGTVTGYHGGVPLDAAGHGLRLNVAVLGTGATVRAIAGVSSG